MSLFERKKGKVEYRYFNKGTSGQIYLGPVGKEDPERVRGALDYLNKARDEYLDRAKKLESQLLALLPAEERRRLQTIETQSASGARELIDRTVLDIPYLRNSPDIKKLKRALDKQQVTRDDKDS